MCIRDRRGGDQVSEQTTDAAGSDEILGTDGVQGAVQVQAGGPDAVLTWDETVAAYDPVLGLEVHVELGTATKMFCGCPTEFGAEPNSQVCPVCLGLPGSLPVVNEKGVESAIRIGLALNCTIAPWCRFARKNYFYPDMPKNFQTCLLYTSRCV